MVESTQQQIPQPQGLQQGQTSNVNAFGQNVESIKNFDQQNPMSSFPPLVGEPNLQQQSGYLDQGYQQQQQQEYQQPQFQPSQNIDQYSTSQLPSQQGLQNQQPMWMQNIGDISSTEQHQAPLQIPLQQSSNITQSLDLRQPESKQLPPMTTPYFPTTTPKENEVPPPPTEQFKTVSDTMQSGTEPKQQQGLGSSNIQQQQPIQGIMSGSSGTQQQPITTPESPSKARLFLAVRGQPSEEDYEYRKDEGGLQDNYDINNVMSGGDTEVNQNLSLQQQPINLSSQQQGTVPPTTSSLDKGGIVGSSSSNVGPSSTAHVHKDTSTSYSHQPLEETEEEYGHFKSVLEPASMKACIVCDYNLESPESSIMYVDKYPAPPTRRLQEDEVVVKVHYAGLNNIDIKVNQGKNVFGSGTSAVHFPFIGGKDACGVVAKLGSSKITRVKEGDAVLGFTNNPIFGTFAQYTIFKGYDLVTKPKQLSFEESASIPFAALSAMKCFQRLNESRRRPRHQWPLNISPLERLGSILVHGGDTQIGSWSILLAKYYFGAARIYTTVQDIVKDEAFVKNLGADVVIGLNDNYDEIIQKDLNRYWDDYCIEQERSTSQAPTTPRQTTVEQQTLTTTEQPIQPTTMEQVGPSSTSIPPPPTMQTENVLVPPPPTQETVQQPVVQQQQPVSSVLSHPYRGFKTKKEMEKVRGIIQNVQLAIDTIGGYDIMHKTFNLLNGSSSYFITTSPPPEIEQRKLSGKEVWKFVSITATNKLKSFFANYPQYHILLNTDCDTDLLSEIVDFYERESDFIRKVLPLHSFDLKDLGAVMEDLRLNRIKGRIVFRVPEEERNVFQ